ncbi:hypothetical protein A2U01_0065935 [Trifolium medium]|uniref:Uncharacterized protein n=1 Tax=Trifolium medium TaxID=97028 RepID=A0A392SA11_9FABA|nr:hypothetical protein [Trifolium medium]
MARPKVKVLETTKNLVVMATQIVSCPLLNTGAVKGTEQLWKSLPFTLTTLSLPAT